MVDLVLLPGLDGTDVFFRPLLSRLPETVSARTICFPAGGGQDYPSLLQQVRSELAAIDSCYVLASSFSGPLAVMLAAAEPRKVRGLILCASFLRSPKQLFSRLRFAARAPLIGVMRTLRRIPVWSLRRSDDPWRIAKAEIWSRVSSRALAARARAVLAVDARALARQCGQPALCLRYDDDRVVAPAFVSEMAEELPRARMLSLAGGHFGMFSDPEPLARTVMSFVSDQENKNRP